MLVFLLLLVTSSCLGGDVTTKFTVQKHWRNNFEGSFCFHLTSDIVGFEIFVSFDSGVKSLRQFECEWLGKHPDCASKITLVNKVSRALHKKGEDLCIRFLGELCGDGTPSGSATLKDLTVDHQKVPAVPHISGLQSTKYNYAEVLEKSILFYEAQRSGKLPKNNRIPWRADSALGDKGDAGEDLTGGWYDAGDNVKFNFPMAWSTTVLTWGLIQWKDAYEKSGQLDYMYDSIRWPMDYLMKCHSKTNELYVQVGDGNIDHSSWTSPERMTSQRPAFKIDTSHGGADVAMETAAALAAGSIVFKTKDAAYSHKLLTQAKSIYDFARKTNDRYSVTVHAAAKFYKSSNVSDELGWGAVWMYKATGDKSYIAEAEKHHDSGAAWGFSWDEKTAGLNMLLYEITKKDMYKQDIIATMKAWMPGGHLPYSPKCLAFRLTWGALRYSANTALIALMAADHGINPEPYRKWAMSQIHYALGDAGRSYVVGFGKNPPTQPHHRASSCPMLPAPCGSDAQRNPGPNPHTLYGALVGGPGKNDDYVDERKDYTKNEVACDYNAGFQSAVAGLLHLSIKHQLPSEYHSICK
ncbi:endoglucanase E-4-like [Patella vulgata]|uniref:endoglucanase E-4-like n=1 Tax=Patella vulgata TaxID=6465 RepID=UPI0024A9F06C|nr:endoglucanase E-4-like [Patella vulgata]